MIFVELRDVADTISQNTFPSQNTHSPDMLITTPSYTLLWRIALTQPGNSSPGRLHLPHHFCPPEALGKMTD